MGSEKSSVMNKPTNINGFPTGPVQYKDQSRRRPFNPCLMFIPQKNLEQEDIELRYNEDKSKSDDQNFPKQESDCQDSEDLEYEIQLQQFSDCLKWNSFIKLKNQNFKDTYECMEVLGKGGFGEVIKVKNKYTFVISAAKKISKITMPKSEKQKLFAEMSILSQTDHPSIIKLFQVYEYMERFIMIFQYFQSGMDLQKYTRNLPNNRWKQQDLPIIMKQVFRSLIYLREKRIIHRDIKCQNFLIQPKSNAIKLIDFGVAVKYNEASKIFKSTTGTPRYMAPEVLQKKYSYEIDVWSCGVMLYRLLCGSFPTFGKQSNDKQNNVKNRKQKLNFRNKEVWDNVSEECKDLIKKMLEKNPYRRIPIEKCLTHPWLQKFPSTRNLFGSSHIVKRISKFKFVNSLQAVVNTYIISQLTQTHERSEILNAFKDIDKNNDGIITYPELFEVLSNLILKKKNILQKDKASKEELNKAFEETTKLMKILDLNKSGSIDYTQFLVGAIKPSEYITQENLQKAFHFFDIDHSGGITIDQFSVFLEGKNQSYEQIKELFNLVDDNGDGFISKDQFVTLLMRMMKNCELLEEQDSREDDAINQSDDLILDSSQVKQKGLADKIISKNKNRRRVSLAEAIREQIELENMSLANSIRDNQSNNQDQDKKKLRKKVKVRNSAFGP